VFSNDVILHSPSIFLFYSDVSVLIIIIIIIIIITRRRQHSQECHDPCMQCFVPNDRDH